MTDHLTEKLTRFGVNNSGSMALLFSISLVATLATVGASLEYSRGSELKSRLQMAADAAVIAASKEPTMSAGERDKLAQAVFAANLVGLKGVRDQTITTTISGQTILGKGAARISTPISGVIGIKDVLIGVTSEAQAGTVGSDFVGHEIALVLDNTGSMRAEMIELRDAASRFVNTVMAGTNKIAVVPYVAAVNPGRTNLGMAAMDVNGDARHHAASLEKRLISYWPSCAPVWGAGGPGAPAGSSTGMDKAELGIDWIPLLRQSATRFAGLFTMGAAAAIITPNTAPGYATVTINGPGGATAQMPVGFNDWTSGSCGIGNPDKISNFDLFDRIPNARWKGCVEARPEPFDVTDAPPNPGNPDTLFVPYFWPDDSDNLAPMNLEYANSYLPDGATSVGQVFGDSNWTRMQSILKYNGSPATIKETPPNSTGPNAGCPDEITPLTSDRTRVLNAISQMGAWNSGGTISSEGLMWGWRALSPGAPLTEGAPYGTTTKSIVIMTDGRNALVESHAGGPTISEYSSYGYLRYGRFPAETYASAEQYLDDRMLLACKNIKDAGIRIFTILYRENDPGITKLMQDCASEPKFYFAAKNKPALASAFDAIAAASGGSSKAGTARLSR